MSIIEVEQVTKTYGTGETAVKALNNVSLSIDKGDFVAIVGASGSGKSTLMHMMGGIDRPDSGRITVDGQVVTELDESSSAIFRRRNVGIVYQFYNLIETLTAAENITVPRLLDGRPADPDKLAEVLGLIGLTDRADHLPSQLSGGQQQRVSIGRALINDPAVILADEPTGNLDSQAGRDVMDLFAVSNQRFGQTLVVITHDEKVALRANRIVQITDGAITADEQVR
jgi:putative ABC transport system ATP-binding protein